MRYYIGPWIWRESIDDGDYWDAPVGTTARIDLRPLPCNIPGYGFFALEKPPVEPGYIELADSLTKSLSSAAKTALIDALKLPSLDATNLRDALAEILTTKADPTGVVRCLPLIPKLNGMLEIVLSGHGVVWERPFTGQMDPAWPNIRKVLQGNYRKIREQALADAAAIRALALGKIPGKASDPVGYRFYLQIQVVVQGGAKVLNPDWTPDDWGAEQEKQAAYVEGQHRRYLDALNAKYAISTEKFIPDDLPVETALPHETTITDDFNRGNEALAAGPWDEVDGNWDVLNNQVRGGGGAGGFPSTARHTTSLSSDDHYSQVTFIALVSSNNDLLGPAARFAAAAETCYYAYVRQNGSVRNIGKAITGTATTLWSDAGGGAPPQVQKLECDGTSISLYDDGVLAQTITNSAISGNVQVGMCAHSVNVADGDNFEAADLEVAVETTFNPNDANCTGWDGLDDTRPPSTLAMDTESGLSGAELNTISADDGNSIAYEQASGYAGHHLRFAGFTAGNVTQITPTVKGYSRAGVDPIRYEYYLYIWDANAGAWEFMASHTSSSKATLTDDVTTNISNYIHNIAGTDYIDILVAGPLYSVTGLKSIYTYYAELVITSSEVVSAFVPWITIF